MQNKEVALEISLKDLIKTNKTSIKVFINQKYSKVAESLSLYVLSNEFSLVLALVL